jgi:hypothetical protein
MDRACSYISFASSHSRIRWVGTIIAFRNGSFRPGSKR